MVEIHDLQPAELPAYVTLFQRSFAQPPWLESWSDAAVRRDLERVQRRSGFLGRVAVASGAIRGAVTGTRLGGVSGFYLAQLFVDPTWQRQGVGQQLLADVLEAMARERRWILLWTRVDSGAESLYVRHGFRRLSVPAWKGRIAMVRRPDRSTR